MSTDPLALLDLHIAQANARQPSTDAKDVPHAAASTLQEARQQVDELFRAHERAAPVAAIRSSESKANAIGAQAHQADLAVNSSEGSNSIVETKLEQQQLDTLTLRDVLSPAELLAMFPAIAFGDLEDPLKTIKSMAEVKASVPLNPPSVAPREKALNSKATVNMQYLVQDLVEAGAGVVAGKWTLTEACKFFGFTIPKSTIHLEAQRQKEGTPHNPVGRPSKLSREDEAWLAAWVRLTGVLGRAPSKRLILERAKAIGDAKGVQFDTKTKLPGESWYERFKTNHSLKSRYAGFKDQRAQIALTRPVLNQFYDLLTHVIQTYKIPPELIFGIDETCFLCHDQHLRVVTGIEVYNPKSVGTEFSEHITYMSSGSAAGATLEPFFILKGKGERLASNPLEGLPPHSGCCFTPKAWSNEESFFLYIRWYAWRLDALYPQLRSEGQYSLLLVDGHSSRMNPDMMEWAAKHRIILLCYPPNCTSKLQPADVSVHAPLKDAVRENLVRLRNNGLLNLTRTIYIKDIIYPALKAGFAATGIYPLNRLAIPDSDLRPVDAGGGKVFKTVVDFVEARNQDRKDIPASVPLPKADVPPPEYVSSVLGIQHGRGEAKEGEKPAEFKAVLLTKEWYDEKVRQKEEEKKKKQQEKEEKKKAKAQAREAKKRQTAEAKEAAKAQRQRAKEAKAAAKAKAKAKAKGKRRARPKRPDSIQSEQSPLVPVLPEPGQLAGGSEAGTSSSNYGLTSLDVGSTSSVRINASAANANSSTNNNSSSSVNVDTAGKAVGMTRHHESPEHSFSHSSLIPNAGMSTRHSGSKRYREDSDTESSGLGLESSTAAPKRKVAKRSAKERHLEEDYLPSAEDADSDEDNTSMAPTTVDRSALRRSKPSKKLGVTSDSLDGYESTATTVTESKSRNLQSLSGSDKQGERKGTNNPKPSKPRKRTQLIAPDTIEPTTDQQRLADDLLPGNFVIVKAPKGSIWIAKVHDQPKVNGQGVFGLEVHWYEQSSQPGSSVFGPYTAANKPGSSEAHIDWIEVSTVHWAFDGLEGGCIPLDQRVHIQQELGLK